MRNPTQNLIKNTDGLENCKDEVPIDHVISFHKINCNSTYVPLIFFVVIMEKLLTKENFVANISPTTKVDCALLVK